MKILAFLDTKSAISFNILSVLQILCRYKWHACRLTCTDKFPNLPTKLRQSIIGAGGGGQLAPPPLATLVGTTDHEMCPTKISFSQTHKKAITVLHPFIGKITLFHAFNPKFPKQWILAPQTIFKVTWHLKLPPQFAYRRWMRVVFHLYLHQHVQKDMDVDRYLVKIWIVSK